MKRLLLVPYTFVLLNWAAMRGLLCYLQRDGLEGIWSEAPRSASAEATGRLLQASKS